MKFSSFARESENSSFGYEYALRGDDIQFYDGDGGLGMPNWEKIETSDEEFLEFSRANRKKAKFLIDENLGFEVASILVDFGCSAVYCVDVGLGGRSDEEVYAYAWRTHRIILTHDNDFLDDTKFPFHRNPGVIILPGAEGSSLPLEKALAKVISLVAPFAKAHVGAKIKISEDGVWTIRGYDKQRGVHVHKRVKLGRNGDSFEWD